MPSGVVQAISDHNCILVASAARVHVTFTWWLEQYVAKRDAAARTVAVWDLMRACVCDWVLVSDVFDGVCDRVCD